MTSNCFDVTSSYNILPYSGAHLGFDFPGVWVHFDIAAPAVSVCLPFRSFIIRSA